MPTRKPAMKKYIIITPVKNEEKYINETLQSIKNQTLQPYKWIIVNDSSTDRTKEMIENYTKDYDPIMLKNLANRGEKRRRGKGVVELFYTGFNLIKDDDFDYVVKLDGDLRLPTDFFEKIIFKFEKNPALGIASGVSYIQKKGKWIRERAAKGYTYGETKVYRKQCFKDIGGLVPNMGWDGIDHIKAVMRGWQASSFDDIIFYHLRPEGKGTGRIKAAYEEGICCYFMGYHPVFLILRSVKRSLHYPYIIGGLTMMLTYFNCTLFNKNRIDDPEFIKFLRKNQLQRILHGSRKYI